MNKHVTPPDLAMRVYDNTAAGRVAGFMCEHHAIGRPAKKSILMLAAELSENVQGQLLAHTGFYNAIIKANASLASYGWRIETIDPGTSTEAFVLKELSS